MKCEKCGHEIKEGDLVCGYCGRSVPKSDLSEETLATLERNERADESLKPNHELNIRSVGIALIIIGISCDIIAIPLTMALDVGSFTTVLTLGSVCFFIGLILTFAFRV